MIKILTNSFVLHWNDISIFFNSKKFSLTDHILYVSISTIFSLFIVSFQPIILYGLVDPISLGKYLYIIGWIHLFVLITPLGLNILLLKNCSIYKHQKKQQLLLGIIYFSCLVTLISSIFIIIILYSLTHLGLIIVPIKIHLFTFLLIIPFMSLAYILSFTIQSLHKASISILLRGPLQITLLISSALILKIIFNYTITTTQLLSIYLFASIITTIVTIYIAVKLLNFSLTTQPQFTPTIWIKNAIPFLVTNTAFYCLYQSDVILIGIFAGEKDVAVYAIASRAAFFSTLGKMVMNAILPSVFSELYSNKEFDLLQRSVNVHLYISVIIFFIATPFIYLLLMPSLKINNDTIIILSILLGGYMVDVFTGPGGFLLTMTGNQKIAANILVLATILNIVLNVIFIPIFDIVGAAIATFISLTLMNVLAEYYSYKKTSIVSGLNLYINFSNYLTNKARVSGWF